MKDKEGKKHRMEQTKERTEQKQDKRMKNK